MKLKEFKFKNIMQPSLSIFDGDKCIATGPIGEVLGKIPHLAEREIKSTNTYFDIFVIRL